MPMSKIFQKFRKEGYFCMKNHMSKKIVVKRAKIKKKKSPRSHCEINLHNVAFYLSPGGRGHLIVLARPSFIIISPNCKM